MQRRVWAFLFLLTFVAPGFARADQAQVFLGGAAFTGVHKDSGSELRNAYILRLPTYALRARHRQIEVLFEDVPPMTLHFSQARYGVHALTVGYGDAAARYWLPGDRFGVGIGDSLYVRKNDYGNGSYDGVRAAGVRYEVLGALPLSRGQRVLARLALSPNMHQRFMEWADGLRPYYEFGKASLVDGSVQFEQPRGGGHTWVWGVRYLNYAGGNFSRYWDHAEERTGVITAFAAWGFTIGH